MVHQMVYQFLFETFDKGFFFHSYSCRIGKGTHEGVLSLKKILRKVSKNGTHPCYALKT
ncbi:hypothetical protein NEPTK9_000929 [Candidatus Neptunochlamydia vexilliferae]|uniref:Uncharacterized protein n=1 Tax=Candidatus Neptunichlamydia vexilliferae TaxID=1651774 RepID=A0ABS0AZP1_9BACT|nr:hypothetical protein [Candidatus Neptunochlamydia vexilliferae]